jgi:4-hydroxybenzoate polyprenyltransferase
VSSRAAIFLRFLRPVTLPAPLAGVLGGAVAASGGWPANAADLAAALASALLLTGASNGINQIADIETDRINRPGRPLPSGAIGKGEAWALVAVLCAAAVALAAIVNEAYLICVAITLPVTSAYSLEPARTKRIPWLANLTIAVPRGFLLVLAGWAVGGGAGRPEAWLLGLAMGVYVFGASVTKDFGDLEGDRATGCRTLPLIYGPARAATIVAPFLVVPFLALPALGAAGLLPGGAVPWTALGLPLALLGVRAGQLLLRDPLPPEDGRPHPAWGLMYVQLTAAHLGTGALFWTLGPPA